MKLSETNETNPVTKIRHALHYLKEHNRLPRVQKPQKSETAALESIKCGDPSFNEGNFLLALEKYNQGICLAPMESEIQAIGYAKRSNVYLKTGFYKFCLENIELSEKNSCPDKLRLELIDIRKKCYEMMEKYVDAMDKYRKINDVKLSYPVKDQLQMMIEGLEVVSCNKYGRHVRAKHDLYPGDIIIIEKPFSKIINSESCYRQCMNCLDRNFMNLIPCPDCTHAMFCSYKCRTESMNVHEYECGILQELRSYPTNILLAVRMTLHAFLTLKEDLDTITDTIKLDSGQNIFRTIYSHTVDASVVDPEYPFMCASVWHLLSEHTTLTKFLQTKDMQDRFVNILFRLGQISASHSHSLESSLVITGENYGTGLFAVTAFLNHSCNPNVMRVTNHTKNVIIVRRNIRKGEQIFDNYGPHHLYHEINERQKLLRLNYNFVCDCDACQREFPKYEDLSVNSSFKQETMADLRRIRSNDRDFIIQKMDEYKKFLVKNDVRYPSYEVCTIQNQLLKCFKMLLLESPLETCFTSHE